jgi:histidyl-tRNA synthetase
MRAADRSGARVAVIIGDRELTEGTATIRDLARSDQEVVPRDTLVDRLRKLIETPPAGSDDAPAAPASEDE